MLGQRAPQAAFQRQLSRRSFLHVGALGITGLTLPQLLKAEATVGRWTSPKSVILIYLVGDPPHQDMFDLKPHAPKEIAGPWRPIATNVAGIQICEAFPRLARIRVCVAYVVGLPCMRLLYEVPRHTNRRQNAHGLITVAYGSSWQSDAELWAFSSLNVGAIPLRQSSRTGTRAARPGSPPRLAS